MCCVWREREKEKKKVEGMGDELRQQAWLVPAQATHDVMQLRDLAIPT